MKNCVFVSMDMEDISITPGRFVQLFEGELRHARCGTDDPAPGILGVSSLAGDGFVASGFHPGLAVGGLGVFDKGAQLYLQNNLTSGQATADLPEENGLTILPVAIALESSDSEHYTQTGLVEALIRIGHPAVMSGIE
jgi:hypothetical protein